MGRQWEPETEQTLTQEEWMDRAARYALWKVRFTVSACDGEVGASDDAIISRTYVVEPKDIEGFLGDFLVPLLDKHDGTRYMLDEIERLPFEEAYPE